MSAPIKPTLNPDWVPGETPDSDNLVDPAGVRVEGYQGGDFPPSEFHNFQFHTEGKWIRYFEALRDKNYVQVTQKNDTDSPYALLETDSNLVYDTSGGASQVDLPPLASAFDASTGLGMRVTIVNIGSNPLTIDADAAELIGLELTEVLNLNDAMTLLATPGAWRRIG